MVTEKSLLESRTRLHLSGMRSRHWKQTANYRRACEFHSNHRPGMDCTRGRGWGQRWTNVVTSSRPESQAVALGVKEPLLHSTGTTLTHTSQAAWHVRSFSRRLQCNSQPQTIPPERPCTWPPSSQYACPQLTRLWLTEILSPPVTALQLHIFKESGDTT